MSKNTIALAYETALCRVIVGAASCCCDLAGGDTPRRTLVNYLRGNQAPPVAAENGASPPDHESHGLLHQHSSSWLERLLDSIVEEGYLAPDQDRSQRVSVTPAGRRLLKGREKLAASILPHPERLGTHPEMEDKLRQMRRRIAKAEGRPPFSVFDNRTLAWLAGHRPRNTAELASAPGFGEKRLAKYGRRVLNVLRRT
jgi:superfamily II DNA helicase RecQ